MGEVIRGVFGEKRKAIAEIIVPLEIKPFSAIEAQFGMTATEYAVASADLDYCLEQDDRVIETYELATLLGEAVFVALVDHPQKDRVLPLQSLLIRKPMRELCNRILSSDAAAWAKRPAYYAALMCEFEGRYRRAISLIHT